MFYVNSKRALLGAAAVGCMVLAGACSSGAASSQSGQNISLDPATLGPDTVIGRGPNGQPPATVQAVQLSPAEAKQVRQGNFEVGIVMQTLTLDWSKLQLRGLRDTFEKYGVDVIGVTAADYNVRKQIADIENMIQRNPDGIVSIPVDNTATASAYEKVSNAGIKLVLMDNVPKGLKHGQDYATMVSADSRGNGWISAEILAARIPQGGTVGFVNFAVDFFVTDERTKGAKNWLAKNRPDITIKETGFTDPDDVSRVVSDFLTANPNIDGLWLPWSRPAMQALTARRAQGVSIPMTTIDLGQQAALAMAKGTPLKGVGAQRPYDQGVAEALAMMHALIGKQPPPWIAIESLPVIQSNLIDAYKKVYHSAPPKALTEACRQPEAECGA